MDQVHFAEDVQLEDRILNEFNKKIKFELHELDYKMFSNVIQKARHTVDLQEIRSKQRHENAPVNPFENTTENIRIYQGKTNDDSALKSNQISLTDIDYAIGFLEYGKIILEDAQDLCDKTSNDTNIFKNCAKRMEATLHIVRSAEFLPAIERKVNGDYFENVISLNDDMLVSGRDLLFKLKEALKNLNFLMKNYLMNYKIISDAVSMVSSLLIEKKLCDNRDSMFDMIKQADNQITMAQKVESKANHFYDMLQPNILEMHCKSRDFVQLNSILLSLYSEYCF